MTIKKAKAPVLGLVYNLVFDPKVRSEFNKTPKKVAEVFGLTESEYDNLITANSTGDFQTTLGELLSKEVGSQLSKPQLLIPNSEDYINTPTISATYNLLHNGNVSDYIQHEEGKVTEEDKQRYTNFFDTFGISDKKVQEAFETWVPEVNELTKSINSELKEVVKEDFSKPDADPKFS
ncbi:hypothetical protein PCIT_b0147 [Pseudoalteromonas citrea]|uniref:Uncharacterized protein n=2 Tax=Pseudoalteromonas citrea TaxID=43655 RepID=A0AAD4AE02_9GAMM|nr:hypothetical protein [Pseudoalteromonas citrea]KAF7764211.1 hypothetical protein PCIT_b0147 [Pseudoalteromonas citrea]